MGSGLSMASVNKIKELANAREYSLALDILDSQDLSRSLNPQFLRLCGEIYTYNHRYRDARHVLLMAHRLAPEARRVIFSLVYLYLKMGYWKLAKQYYDIYMFDANESVPETKQLMYIYDKAMKKNIDELESYIAPTYSHTMDYIWTYETILVYMVQGRSKEAEVLAQVYGATFKNTENSFNVQDIFDGKKEAMSLFDIFADAEADDDDPKQEMDREEEGKLLAADELRIHPKEAEIMIMVDDNDDDEIVPKRKLKKLLQEQEVHDNSMNASEQTEGSEKDGDFEEKKEKKGILKSIFPKKKKRDETAENGDAVPPEEAEQDNYNDKAETIETAETAETVETTETAETADTKVVSEVQDAAEAERKSEEAAYREAREVFFGESETRDVEDGMTSAVETEQENEETDMREIHIKEHNSISNAIVSVDMGEDDFTAESDTVEEIRDNAAFSNPFDSLIATKTDDSVSEYKVKKSISFETAELAEDDEADTYEVDDFSSAEDDEFGEMITFKPEPASCENTEPEPEPEPEAEVYEEAEPEPETEEEAYEEAEPEPEPEPETETEVCEEEIKEPERLSDDNDMLFQEQPKKELDYPVFRSSLFPDYHNDAEDVENNFDEIMHEAQDKIQKNILKEEQMLREAESLLASLGIEMEDIVTTSDSYDNMSEALYDGPSRDELKASLKIDSTKRDILRKLKEYR